MKQSEKREQYERLLGRREREGLSYRELAEASGIPMGTLAWWGSRLRKGKAKRGGRRRRFVELVPGTVEAAGGGHYELQLLSGRRVIVEGAFEDEALARLVRVLEGAC